MVLSTICSLIVIAFAMAMQAESFKISTRLYVASYSGTITSLNYLGRDFNSTPVVSQNSDCGPSPTWLVFDGEHRYLHCLNEGIDQPTGSITSYQVDMSATLTKLGRLSIPSAPVHGSFLNNKTEMIVSHYFPGAVSIIDLKVIKSPKVALVKDFPNITTNTVPDRQYASFAHEIVRDPLNKYFLIPDLGADVVHILGVTPSTNSTPPRIKDYTPLRVPAGTGPRHAVFWSPQGQKFQKGDPLFFIVLGELSAKLSVYKAKYSDNDQGMSFEAVNTTSATGTAGQPKRNAPAEITVSPDNRFIVLSNRGDLLTTLGTASFPGAAANEPSDSLSTFSINYDSQTSSLDFRLHQVWPAGGLHPRHFAFNQRGDVVAVGLQKSNRVVLMTRDVNTGMMGPVSAVVEVTSPTNIMWDEA